MSQTAPLAMQSVKEVLRAIECLPLKKAFSEMRSGKLETYSNMLSSDDAAEGVAAFVEKETQLSKENDLKASNKISTVASIGGGPIGAGWAAHFLAKV